MNPSQASYLLQKVAPLVMRELGPRVGPLVAEKVGIPLAKKVGLPIARRIGIPIARKTGTLLLNKVGYPLLNKMLFKVNLDPSNSSLGSLLSSLTTPPGAPVKAQPPQQPAPAKPPKAKRSLRNLIRPKKANNKFVPNKNNVVTPVAPVPVVPAPLGSAPRQQIPPQMPLTNQVVPNNYGQPNEQNPYPYAHNSSLFNRRRQNFGYDFE